MLNALGGAITSRAAGPIASAAALVLAVVFAVSWSSWEARRTALEGQVADLTRQAERSQALWKAQLAACHEAGGEKVTQAAYGPDRLLQGPEGIDACARMENADKAVLSNLK